MCFDAYILDIFCCSLYHSVAVISHRKYIICNFHTNIYSRFERTHCKFWGIIVFFEWTLISWRWNAIHTRMHHLNKNRSKNILILIALPLLAKQTDSQFNTTTASNVKKISEVFRFHRQLFALLHLRYKYLKRFFSFSLYLNGIHEHEFYSQEHITEIANWYNFISICIIFCMHRNQCKNKTCTFSTPINWSPPFTKCMNTKMFASRWEIFRNNHHFQSTRWNFTQFHL